jgi:hypothetical protein
VSLGFLAMTGNFAAEPIALTFALASPVLGRSSDYEHCQGKHDYDGDDDGDHGDR